MYRIIHIFMLFVMAAVAVVAPASASAQEERQTREVFRGEFQMKGDFSREGAQLVSRPPHGIDDYFKIMPGDNITHWETKFGSAEEIVIDDWILRVQLRRDARTQSVHGTGEVRFTINGTTYRGEVSVEEATCQSLRQPVTRGLFEGCYKYELKGKLRFVEVPADAAEI
jgi:hypothetical protein